MAQFQISRSEFMQLLKGGDASKLYQALQRAIQDFDYASGIVAKPSNGQFQHGLSVVPRQVWVWGYDAQNGETAVPELATSVTKTTITVGGAKAYYQVLAQR